MGGTRSDIRTGLSPSGHIFSPSCLVFRPLHWRTLTHRLGDSESTEYESESTGPNGGRTGSCQYSAKTSHAAAETGHIRVGSGKHPVRIRCLGSTASLDCNRWRAIQAWGTSRAIHRRHYRDCNHTGQVSPNTPCGPLSATHLSPGGGRILPTVSLTIRDPAVLWRAARVLVYQTAAGLRWSVCRRTGL